MRVLLYLLCIIAILNAQDDNDDVGAWMIIGGHTAEDGQFPHQVSLRYHHQHTCGASIIDEYTILCAAHCVDGKHPKAMSVHMGTNKLDHPGQHHSVKSYTMHKKYHEDKFKHDICIIKLYHPISFNDKVKAVKLRKSDVGIENVILSGWGMTKYPEKPATLPNDLQFIELRTTTVEECRRAHEKHSIDQSLLCTYTKRGEGTCFGDSGGPLIDEQGRQVGIVSWGKPCGAGKPDVFTRISTYYKWVQDHRK